MNEILITSAILIITVTISILYYLYKTRCFHKWKIINENEQRNTYRRLVDNKTFEVKFICYTCQCEKCGKLFITKDPNKTNGKIM